MNRNWILPIFFLVVAILILFGSFPTGALANSDLILPWSQTSSLSTIANHSSFSHNNYLYSLGGSTLDDYSVIQRTKINENGSLNGWGNFGSLPMTSYYHSSILNGDRIYVLGGTQYPPANSIDNVLLASVDSNGNISNWTPLTPLPKKLSKGKAVIVNNRIYFVGGATWTNGTGPVISNNVYFANINVDGTIGGWTTTTSLPTPLSGHGLIEANGKIITLGGSTNPGETPINKTYSAVVNADGTLGSWSEGTSLPIALRDGGAVKIGSYAIYTGGYSGQFSNKVYYSLIDLNGNLGAWTQSANNLPINHCCGGLAVWYNRLYLSGGYNGSNYLNTVYTASTTAANPPPTPTPTPTPTASPTPTSSPTPTPTPTTTPLNVLNLKQYNPLWGNQIYDHLNATIRQFGCALTSASMVLKYFGHAYADPDILNNWLISQTDGYLANGLVNWLAVTRYTKINSSLLSPTLEYRRLAASNETLINELTESRPAILKEPGHFVVAKSQTSDSFGINDPGYDDRTTLVSYGNIFLAINSFRPTFTDLSYILLVLDGDKKIKVFDPEGNEITGYSFIEEPLADDTGGSEKSGKSLTIFQYPTPLDGIYKVEVTGSSGTYSLDSYLYKIDGSVTANSYQGLIKEGQIDIFLLSTGGVSQSTVPVITIDSLIDDLDNAYSLGLITKKSVYKSLRQELLGVKKLLQKKNKNKHVIKLLVHIIKINITGNTPRYIKQPASDILINDIDVLISSL